MKAMTLRSALGRRFWLKAREEQFQKNWQDMLFAEELSVWLGIIKNRRRT
jgi:hypothetical protein